MIKAEFKNYVQECFRKRRYYLGTSIAVSKPDGLTFDEAKDIVESMGGDIGKFPVPSDHKESWSIGFGSIIDQQKKFTNDFKKDIQQRISAGAKKFVYKPKVYPYPIESIDFKDAKEIIESLGGMLYQSVIKGVWRIDFTNLFDDFLDYVYDQARYSKSFSIKQSDCPLITFGIVNSTTSRLRADNLVNLEFIDEYGYWTFKRN